jgi:hypothetical protein
MERIEISRADFEERFGVKPDPSSLGMFFYLAETGQPSHEFVFIDDALPCESPVEVEELYRMWNLK